MVAVQLGPAPLDLLGVRAGDRNLVNGTVSQNGTPVDLTGLTFSAQARRRNTDADPALTAVVEVVDASAGTFTMRWPGEDVAVLLGSSASWSGVWDLQMGTAPDDLVTVLAGRFTAVMDVTRP